MSRKGCSPHNAACEGFFGRPKTELFYPRDWRATTIDQFIGTLDTYIQWYNATRIKVSLGSLSPLKYRESLRTAALPLQDFSRTPGGSDLGAIQQSERDSLELSTRDSPLHGGLRGVRAFTPAHSPVERISRANPV
jgi:hypothetical protein